MRPGGLRRTAWAGLLGLLGGAATVLATPAPATADITVNEVYGRPASGSFQLLGHGWGHGRGLSQYGGQGAAQLYAGKESATATADRITSTYYPGTTKLTLSNTSMRVQLREDDDNSTTVWQASGLYAKDLATGTKITLGTDRAKWRVKLATGGLQLYGLIGSTWTAAGPVRVGPIEFMRSPDPLNSMIRVDLPGGGSRDYRWAVRAVKRSDTLLNTIVVMPMEAYLLGVVPRESPSSFAAAALQAQSIAARSYSAYQRGHAPSTRPYDICDTTACQVFGGSASYTASGTRTNLEPASTTAAVKATAGVVRAYQGGPIFAEFSASNGGWSTDGDLPYLVAKADPWDGVTGSSVHSWEATLPVVSLECRYGPKNSDGSCARRADGSPEWRLTRVTITQRDGNGEWGGRVQAAVIAFVDSTGAAHRADASGSGFYYARTWPTYSDGLRSRWFHIVPEYDAGSLTQSTAPTLIQPPGTPTTTLRVNLTNTGNATWPVSGLHLALASPAGGADPLVGGSTRPGHYVQNFTHPGATSVLPGDRVQLAIDVDATGLAAGTRTPSYRLRIGTASLFGPTLTWKVVVQDPVFTGVAGAAPALVSTTLPDVTGAPPALFADGKTVVVPRTGSTTLRLTTTNTGNLTWPVGSSSPVQLGTSAPRDRTSASSGSTWVSAQRAARLAGAAAVGPGKKGTFDLVLNGNGKGAGVTGEAFEPVWQDEQWITGHQTALTVVRVDTNVSRAAVTELAPVSSFGMANAPTGKRLLVVRLRNVGKDAWKVGQEQLGTSTAFPMADHWPASNRTPGLHGNLTRAGADAVFPGEVGEWWVPVTAYGKTVGTYTTTLRAVGPSGSYGPSFALTGKVLKPSFTWTVVGHSPTAALPSNGTGYVWMDLKNTSNFAWTVGGSLRSTVVSGSSPSRASSWYSASRPGSLSSNLTHPGLTYVRAGEVGRFRVLLAGNGRAAQSRTESFGMSWDGWRSTSLSVSLAYRIV